MSVGAGQVELREPALSKRYQGARYQGGVEVRSVVASEVGEEREGVAV